MSTKCTLLHGEEYHLYIDGFDYVPTLEVKDKVVELPQEFMLAIRKLISLHGSFKNISKLSKELDKIDGGLFSIDLKTGEETEL